MDPLAIAVDVVRSAFHSASSFWSAVPDAVKYAVSVMFGAATTAYVAGRRSCVDELRCLSTAHALSFSIANNALALKKQYIQEIKSAFDVATEAHDAYVQAPSGEFIIPMDLRSLSEVTFPTGHLEKLVCQKLFLGAKGVATVIALSSAVEGLCSSLQFRNELVREFRENHTDKQIIKVSRYLGLYYDENCDERFRDNVEALYSKSDEVIFFAQFLGEFVVRFENKLRRGSWFFFLPGRKLKSPDWSRAERDGLLPKSSNFAEWTNGFVTQETFLARLKAALRIRIAKSKKTVA